MVDLVAAQGVAGAIRQRKVLEGQRVTVAAREACQQDGHGFQCVPVWFRAGRNAPDAGQGLRQVCCYIHGFIA